MEKMSSSLKLLWLVLMNVVALCMPTREIISLDWVIQEASYMNTHRILTVNGRFPGPALHLCHGDRLKVNVHNQGNNEVAVHWHGVKHIKTPFFEHGSKHETKRPINPKANVTYEITFLNEEGTLWWQANIVSSGATIHGPIFVYPELGKQYPYPVKPDGEIPIVIGSWYKGDVMQIKRSGVVTINGQPGDTQSFSKKDMFGMIVDHGKTYLLRIINTAMGNEMLFVVANHDITVVGVDAAYIKPLSTNSITIAPSQTMDVLLVANQPRGRYYLVARAYGGIMATAVIQYAGNYIPPVNATFPTLSNSIHGGVDKYSKFSAIV